MLWPSPYWKRDITDRLLDITRDKSVEIVVMGAVARNAVQRIFVGSTADNVLDKLPADLLVVHPYQDGKLSLNASAA